MAEETPAISAGAEGAEDAGPPPEKRPRISDAEGDPEAKAAAEAVEAGPKRVKRKLALVFGFVGQQYRGLQINYEIEEKSKKKSVEEMLRQALVRAGAVTALNAEKLEQKIGWSRSSRTDQGVSAARIVVSGKFLLLEDGLNDEGHSAAFVAEVNRELPGDVRCFAAVKVPNSFDAKRACSWREYEYLMPVAMARDSKGSEDSMSPEQLARRLEGVIRKFEGNHSFHNFTRLKAADLTWKEDKDGKGQGKGKGKGKAGKGKKGKGKGQKRKAGGEDEADAEQDSGCEDGGPGDSEAEAEAPAPAVEADRAEAPAKPAEPPWVEICARDASGAWRERNEQVMKHTNSTIFMCAVEPTRAGALLRVRLRGKFFLYNQIRLMVGTAAAVAAGRLPAELLDLALALRVEMHMPLAPPTGLLLRTAGFCEMDQRLGSCAMDSEQASSCMLPAGGFTLIPDGEAADATRAFGDVIEAKVEAQWLEGNELSDWLTKLAEVRVPGGAVLEDLRAKAKAVEADEADFRESQAAADRRRRESRLASGGSFVGVMPRRFASDLMVRFRLMPGWRVSHLQHALTLRMRRWEKEPEERPKGLSPVPETHELLEYIASVGVDVLAEEGSRN